MSCMKNGFIQGVLLDGRFTTVSPLNHGSFGMVFLARDNTNNQLVAIKCLAKSSDVDNPAGNDHLIELTCHARLGHHPNVVNLVHAFESDHHMYLVLEFCSMGDLYEAIKHGRGPLETEHVRDFMLQLVAAIEFMHAKGLYHRDIKPENIFLAYDGSLKIGDFGLSTTESWTYEACVGSDRYMAPEQYDPADVGYSPAQADIWSIGICLLNILFSRNPFMTPSPSDPLFYDFVRDTQSLFDIFPSMSQDTFEVLNHALAVDPTKRSLTGLRKALGRVLSFTMEDDVLDEFCVEDRIAVPASANRQPLRTPSIQSPQVEQTATFPWVRSLLSPLKSGRQLSAIIDREDENDDLFPGSTSRPINVVKPASLVSVIDSALGASVQSMKLREPKPRNAKHVTGSLPISASKPIKALSSIFGKKNNEVSKSWSDMWDEEEEEQEDARRFNDNNWSTDTLDVPAVRPGRLASKNAAILGARSRSPVHAQLGVFMDSSSEDVSSFEDQPVPSYTKLSIYSPPAKRTSPLDKWAALGNRRRACASTADLKEKAHKQVKDSHKRRNTGESWRRGSDVKQSAGNTMTGTKSGAKTGTKGLGFGLGPVFDLSSANNGGGGGGGWGGRMTNKDIPNGRGGGGGRDIVRIRDWRTDRYNRAGAGFTHSSHQDDGEDADVEWVGGWHDLHL